MRNTFIRELIRLAHTQRNIALVVGDLGYSVVEEFADTFPDRFFNAGVAEQNMMGLSAGMASEGYHVFVYSIANFPTFRCAEQIRNDVDYHNLPVTVVSVGGGLSYGNLGYSHHAIQDYGLMRLFPNMLIAAPGDPHEVTSCLRYLVRNPGPSYLRLGKAGEPTLHAALPVVEPGKWLTVKKSGASIDTLTGLGSCFLSTGSALKLACDWAQKPEFSNHAVLSLPLWGARFKQFQASQVSQWQKVVSIEDHLVDCGFGSWLRESLGASPELHTKLSSLALDSSVCGMVGRQEVLNAIGGIAP